MTPEVEKEQESEEDFWANQPTPTVRIHSAPGISKCEGCEG